MMALKVTCSLFIIYYCLISVIFPSTASLLTPMCGLMLAVVIVYIVQNQRFFIEDLTFPIIMWLLFGVTSFASSIFTASDVSLALDSAFTFIKLTLMCFCVVYISKETDDYEYLIYVMYLISLIYAIYMIMKGNYRGIRLTIGNANTDANVCLIGVVTASWIITQKKDQLIRLFLFGTVLFFAYVNLMTGSRKSFICLAFYVIGWILIEIRPLWARGDINTRLTAVLFIVVLSIAIYKIGIPIITNSSTYSRIVSENAYNENDIRQKLYKEAWYYFKQSPIFGIGYNQFRVYNSEGIYSHSTYAEIASNCGIIGIILFFTPHVWSTKNMISIIKKKREKENDGKLSCLFLLYLISTFILATGMVQTNNERVLLMYALMFSFILCERNRLNIDQDNLTLRKESVQKKYKYIK